MSGCDYCFGNKCSPCTEAMGTDEKEEYRKSIKSVEFSTVKGCPPSIPEDK